MNNFLRTSAIAFAALTVVTAAQAHNAWLRPASTVLSKGDVVSVDAAISNDLFVANHAAMRLDNLLITAPDGSKVTPDNAAQLKQRSVFDVNASQPGTYRVAVLNNGLFANWKDKATGQAKRARGTAETIAKQVPADAQDVVITQTAGRVETFITVGKPSAIQPAGQGLELIAKTSPTDLAKGEAATFTLLLDGQPAADLEVAVTAGDTQYRDRLDEMKLKTNAQGQFSVTWPHAGMYWIEASTRDNKTSLPNASARRLSYSATLEVMP